MSERISPGGDVIASDMLVAFEDIAAVFGGTLSGRTIASLALALVDNRDALLPWLEAQ